jgi:hypothetical protein
MSTSIIRNPSESVSWPAFKDETWNQSGKYMWIGNGSTKLIKYPYGLNIDNDDFTLSHAVAFVAVFASVGGKPAELYWAGFVSIPDNLRLSTITGSTSKFTVAKQRDGLAFTASAGSLIVKGLWMY